MATWRRGSTPTNIFCLNVDLRGAMVYITYKQNGEVIVEKSGDDIAIEETYVSTKLTQKETLRFKDGVVRIQIRYVRESGQADASNILETRAEEILKDGEIFYE